MDLRSCRGCRFYASSLANECSEARAEAPVEKEKANYCDFFVAGDFGAVAGSGGRADRTGAASSSSSARSALDKLFKS